LDHQYLIQGIIRNKLFYDFTVHDIDLNIPIGCQEYYDQIIAMKNYSLGEIASLPVTISIGYHHEF